MDQLLVSTRKGLFSARRQGKGAWALEGVSFLGDNVSLAMQDPRDGAWYAALDHG
ncbi:MAG TPA: sialidase, partial [Holophagaceae bacterium]|nr:sialidase [Holophagaceae bacterium]